MSAHVRRWQSLRERLIEWLLAGCALFSIAVTLSIVGVLAAETLTTVKYPRIVRSTSKDVDQDEYASGRAQRAGTGVSRCLARR